MQDIIYDNDFEAFLKYIKINDPSENDSIAFSAACEYNRIDMVKILIKDKRINPLNRDNAALYSAFNQDLEELIDVLITHPDIVKELSKKDEFLYVFYKDKILQKTITDF